MSGPAGAAPARIAVLGGGWAGCAAALVLARSGHRVSLFEAGPVLGGRARRVMRAGLPLDNGQHLLLGAYRSVLELMTLAHGPDAERGRLIRTRLALLPADPSQTAAVALNAPGLRAPLGLLVGILRARGLTPGERLGVVRWFLRLQRRGFRRPAGETVAALLALGPARAAAGLWEPLCLAALNTPPERASAQVFANVLQAAFAAATGDADLLLPATNLSALFPEAAARLVTGRGGEVRTGVRAEIETADPDGVAVRAGGDLHRFAGAVVAVGPHQLAHALAAPLAGSEPALRSALAAVAGLDFEPIATVWLGYASASPLCAPMLRLDDRPGQWCFDRPDIVAAARPDPGRPPLRQVLGVVVSAHGPHEEMDAATLAAACEAQLARLLPGRPSSTWSQVIVEKRATYACVPGRPRPDGVLPLPRLALAGDYMDVAFPATLEAAVRSGIAAATGLAASLRPATPASR